MKNRSVLEIMILVFTGIVAFFIVGLGVLILVVEVRNPEADTGVIANTLSSLVSGILGALLGLIAGKATNGGLSKRPDGTEADLTTPPPPPPPDDHAAFKPPKELEP